MLKTDKEIQSYVNSKAFDKKVRKIEIESFYQARGYYPWQLSLIVSDYMMLACTAYIEKSKSLKHAR